MTRYILDRDVMSQLDRADIDRHQNVRAWLASVPDNALFVSAITIMEAWRGLAAVRRKSGENVVLLNACDGYEAAFRTLMSAFTGRVLAIDEAVAEAWGRALGHQDKNRNDVCVAVTARTHGMVVATRNIKDFTGRGADTVAPSTSGRVFSRLSLVWTPSTPAGSRPPSHPHPAPSTPG